MRHLSPDGTGSGQLAFSPDGWLYGLFGKNLVGWQLAAGNEPAWTAESWDRGFSRRLTCSPCGRWLVEGNLVGVFDRVSDHDRLTRAATGGRSFVFTPDGAAALQLHPTHGVERIDTATWQRYRNPYSRPLPQPADWHQHPNPSLLAVSPDGRLAACDFHDRSQWPTRDYIGVWELTIGGRITRGTVEEFGAESLHFTTDGTGLLRDDYRTLTRLDPTTLERTATYRSPGGTAVEAVAVSPDGRGVLVGTGKRIALLDPTHLSVVTEYDFGLGPLTRVAVAPDGLTAAACGASGRVVRFDLD